MQTQREGTGGNTAARNGDKHTAEPGNTAVVNQNGNRGGWIQLVAIYM